MIGLLAGNPDERTNTYQRPNSGYQEVQSLYPQHDDYARPCLRSTRVSYFRICHPLRAAARRSFRERPRTGINFTICDHEPLFLISDTCGFRFLVNNAFRDVCKLLVGVTFFVQRFLQQLCDVPMSQLLSEGTGAAIAGDLVMLDFLRGANQRGIEHVWL